MKCAHTYVAYHLGHNGSNLPHESNGTIFVKKRKTIFVKRKLQTCQKQSRQNNEAIDCLKINAPINYSRPSSSFFCVRLNY
jgi:hypothetical protein